MSDSGSSESWSVEFQFESDFWIFFISSRQPNRGARGFEYTDEKASLDEVKIREKGTRPTCVFFYKKTEMKEITVQRIHEEGRWIFSVQMLFFSVKGTTRDGPIA